MLPALRFLQQWLTVGLLAALPVAATLGQAAPRTTDPAKANPEYNARKRQLAELLRGKYPPPAAARATPRPGAQSRTAASLPPCAEPFDAANPAGWTQVERGDDPSLGPIALGFGFQYFGTTYTQVYINTNGNITFNRAYPAFSSSGLPIRESGDEDIAMLAPFWADVDTQNDNGGAVWYRLFPDRLVVTYDRVGYYLEQADKLNTFQVIIRANTAPGFAGDDVTFAYGDMQWTTAISSGGSGGFGGQLGAVVGGNVGDQQNFFEFGRFNQPGSAPPNMPAPNSPGGIDWLDNQCIGFQVRSRNNPPAAVGLAQSTTFMLNQGETRSLTAQFFGSEGNQNVTVTPSLGGLCNATANLANNDSPHPTLNFSVTGAACNVGSNTVSFRVQDNGTPAQTQTYTVTVVVSPGASAASVWTGAASTDYNDPANWSNNRVPSATDDVSIPSGVPRMPLVSSTGAARNLSIATGAALGVAESGALTITGNLANNGTLGGLGTLLANGPAAQTLSGSGSVSVGSLTVGAAGAQLAEPVAISKLLTLTGNLATNNNLTLLSSANGTATVVNLGAAEITGNARVQQYISGARNGGLGYRHLASPVAGSSIAGVQASGPAGFAPVVNPAYNTAPQPGSVIPFPNLFFYEQSRVTASGRGAVADFDLGWVSPGSTAELLVPGQGYTANIAPNQIISFAGQPNNGTIARNDLGRNAAPQAGWHLLGNPYPSPIDWNLTYAGATNLENTVYVFKSNGPYSGSYASYVAGSGVSTNGGSNILPVAQGFFVRTSTPGANGSLTFTNAARVAAPSNAPLERTTHTHALAKISLNGAGTSDQVAVYFRAGATPAFDSAFDAHKLSAGGNMLAIGDNPNALLSISGLPLLGSAPVAVPLLTYLGAAGNFTLKADELLNLPAGTAVHLLDAATGAVVDLQKQPTYAFAAEAGLATSRFSLLFTPARPLATAGLGAQLEAEVFPNPAHDRLWIRLPAGSQIAEAVLFNSLGQAVQRQTIPGGQELRAMPLQHLALGIYTLHLHLGQAVVVKRVVVN
ncbi:T9SS C-terminal target domain-containing protein [Hymenobacter oligotrophus]|uniref:T9SS C-terminal target domain-containing protein n=1 Tax=Hymenobacter oligotrophus TaxID=2319843 RepID=A0A3B7QY64_9BACT|nr:nidogen-like domain-containing protein [Hymenobacter oligotrophus]AYA36754.1 T9SS C-terminal target domain-containing protein [Hymenobacter oligotrophus]